MRRTYVDASLLLRWLGTLPDDLVRHRPQLCLLYAWALAHSGALEEAERRLRDTEEALGLDDGASTAGLSDEERTMLGEICIIRARMAAMRENAPLTTELSNRALELLPEDELHLRGDVALDLGHAYCSVGDLESASEAFARAAATGRAADDLRTALFALRYQASQEISRGRLRKAEELLLDGQRLAESRPDGVPSVAGIIHAGMGELLYERGDLDEAQKAPGGGYRARQAERRGEDTGLRLRQPGPRVDGPGRCRGGALPHQGGRRAHTEVAAHLGVAGAVLAGAGRRGVGGALVTGVRGDRGLHELPTPLRADNDGPRAARGGQDRRGSRLPSATCSRTRSPKAGWRTRSNSSYCSRSPPNGWTRRARRWSTWNARSRSPHRRASCASSSMRGCRWRPCSRG